METLQLREEFYWTGIVDDQLRVFDINMYTEFGTTYKQGIRRFCLRRQKQSFLTNIWKN